MIQLSRNYSLPERTDGRNPDQSRRRRRRRIECARSHRARWLGKGRAHRDQHRCAIARQFGRRAQGAARPYRYARTWSRGDPELGYNAAVESADEIREALADARMIFVCAGLGGGTGSGAAPMVAQVAREAGSLVVAFATLPFSFEGKRRTAQARRSARPSARNRRRRDLF